MRPFDYYAHAVASDQARADPGDPHVYSRIMSHLRAGVTTLRDYNVDFRTITREFHSLATGRVEEYPVEVPHNRELPF
jgi:hypothetical protein|tara:strand:- start:14166 stop:14399 length:234 start_codon:yes stop_codon:yes gene_type:complete